MENKKPKTSKLPILTITPGQKEWMECQKVSTGNSFAGIIRQLISNEMAKTNGSKVKL